MSLTISKISVAEIDILLNKMKLKMNLDKAQRSPNGCQPPNLRDRLISNFKEHSPFL